MREVKGMNAQKMHRVGFVLKVKADRLDEYKRRHEEVWPEMLHVWHIQTASLPQAHDALQRAGEFLIGHLEK